MCVDILEILEQVKLIQLYTSMHDLVCVGPHVIMMGSGSRAPAPAESRLRPNQGSVTQSDG